MSWIFLGLLSAVLVATGTLLEKKALTTTHAMAFSAGLALVNAVLTLPLFLFIDWNAVSFPMLAVLFGISLFGAIAYLFVAKGMRHLPVSEVSPLLAFGPVFTTPFAALTLNERLDVLQTVGIGFVVAGAYLLETRAHASPLEPFRVFARSRAVHLVLGAIIIYGVLSVFDRFALAYYGIPPLAYLAFVHLFLAFHFLWMMAVFHGGFREAVGAVRTFGVRPMLLIALVTIGHRVAETFAMRAAYAGLVTALKRTAVLFSTVIGGEMFHEDHLVRKTVAAVIMVAGTVLMVI